MASTSLATKVDKELAALVAVDASDIRRTIAAPQSKKISTKGKVFTLPNGDASPGPLKAVILDYVTMNSYYPNAYNPQNIAEPECFALGRYIDELAPGSKAKKPQNATCNGCPMNEWGSAPVGRGKACKNQRRLVLAAPDATDPTGLMTLYVTPSGLAAFDAHVSRIAKEYGSTPIRVVSEISFNPNEAYPTLVFNVAEALEGPGLKQMVALRDMAQDMLLAQPAS